jgi:hypothetical protein
MKGEREPGRNFIKIGIDFRIHFVFENEFEVQEPFLSVFFSAVK